MWQNLTFRNISQVFHTAPKCVKGHKQKIALSEVSLESPGANWRHSYDTMKLKAEILRQVTADAFECSVGPPV